ncbi:DUF6017 domain-containing protein [Robinsoniella peoriensis]|uniref:DUF6017 domain-containing protein n=1 Tax=Robinsoniella peoriensis TaxID=180332 RepID=UPI00085C5F6C
MDQIRAYTNIVKTNIEYDILISDCNIGDREYIDEMVELMVETITIPRWIIVNKVDTKIKNYF